jgi:GAF domain-containing protein
MNIMDDMNMTKQKQYENLLPQIQAVMDNNVDIIANMANMAAMLHETFGFWWTGFYRVIGNELVLGPFQGPLACTRIPYGRGVCGSAWKERRTLVVPDVEQFPGHIACSSASRSEIVVPVFRNNEIIAVLDIDSEQLGTFDDIDAEWLGKLVQMF